MIKHKRVLTWTLTAFCLAMLSVICTTRPALANDAGIGTEVHDGECRWWGTCSTHGLAWVEYQLLVNPSGLGLHLHYTENTGGPVNFGDCQVSDHMRLYNYGFIAFNDKNSSTDPHTSYNQQVATIKRSQSGAKYMNEKFGATTPDQINGAVYNRSRSDESNFIADKHYKMSTTRYVKEGTFIPGEKGTCYERYAQNKNGGYQSVAYAFCLMDEADRNNGNQNYLHGTTWNDVGWFCYDSTVTNHSRSEIEATVDGKKAHAKAFEQTVTADGAKAEIPTITVAKDTIVAVDFVHAAWAERVDNAPKTTWTYQYTIDGEEQKTGSRTVQLKRKVGKIEKTNPAYVSDAEKDKDNNTGIIYTHKRNIKVTDTKSHIYCERQYLNDNGTEKNITEVCVTLKGVEETSPGSYLASSMVKANGQSSSTEISTSDKVTLKINVSVGATVSDISFIHYGYSDVIREENTKWTKVFGKTNSEKFCPSSSCNNNPSPTVEKPLKTAKNGFYTTNKATFKSSYGSITFAVTGTYKFCEAIQSGDKTAKTTACLTVIVGDSPDDDDPPPDDDPPNNDPPVTTCADHAPSSYSNSNKYSGVTSTWSMVATVTDLSRKAESGGSIWAKPGDKIYFEHCYFPGAQAVRTNDSSWPHKDQLTDSDYASLPKYNKSWSNVSPLSNRTFSSRSDYGVGDLTKVVTADNDFTVSTGEYTLLAEGNNINFSVTGSGFSASQPNGHSVSARGTLGNTSDSKTTTNNLTILTSAAGKTISQNITGWPGAASISTVDKGNSGTWSYAYPYKTYDESASSSSTDPKECPSNSDVQKTIYLVSGDVSSAVTYGEVTGCKKVVDQEAEECGEDDENCTPKEEMSHYEWNEWYPAANSATATWYIVHTNNEESPTFKDYWTSPSSSGSASSAVYVNVPYNYNNSINVEFADGNIYSGETFGVKEARVTVDTRRNNTTDGDYATIVPNSLAKLYVFHSATDLSSRGGSIRAGEGDCGYYSGIGGLECAIAKTDGKALNTSMSTSGSNSDTFFSGQSYNVYDLKAGEYMCIGASIWPATSNGDTDMGTSGNNTAAYSAPVCQRVFKRPTFQVWNGGLYSAGKVVANSFTKNVLNGYSAYRTSGSDGQYTFSSWIEQGIVANKSIVGLASGAATGFTSNSNGVAANNPGGISGTDFCDMSTLTIPNTSCRNFNGVNFVSAGLQRAKNTIYDTIYNAIINGRTYKAVSGSINLADANNYSETTPGMRYTESSDNSTLTISASSPLTRNLSHVIHAKGNLTIASNLTYDMTISYTTSSQVPQYMIFADGDIDINCGVGRIDAWLVARGTINTCADVEADDVNNAARSHQLFVRGVLIADKLELTRTYGASTGKDSAIPAEIFLLSAENRFFGKSSSSEDPTLYTVYLRELSPRY